MHIHMTFEVQFEAIKKNAIGIVLRMHELDKHVYSEDEYNLDVIEEEDEDEEEDDGQEPEEREYAAIQREFKRNASVQQKRIWAIRDVYWEKPDDGIANSEHIETVQALLEAAAQDTGSAHTYFYDILKVNDQCRLLEAALRAAHPDQHDAEAEPSERAWGNAKMIMGLTHDVEKLRQRVHTLETNNSGLNETVRRLGLDIREMQSAARELAVKKAARTRWPFRADVSPHTQTLPALLAQLTRPDTP